MVDTCIVLFAVPTKLNHLAILYLLRLSIGSKVHIRRAEDKWRTGTINKMCGQIQPTLLLNQVK